jgi:hypothetical protein
MRSKMGDGFDKALRPGNVVIFFAINNLLVPLPIDIHSTFETTTVSYARLQYRRPPFFLPDFWLCTPSIHGCGSFL